VTERDIVGIVTETQYWDLTETDIICIVTAKDTFCLVTETDIIYIVTETGIILIAGYYFHCD